MGYLIKSSLRSYSLACKHGIPLCMDTRITARSRVRWSRYCTSQIYSHDDIYPRNTCNEPDKPQLEQALLARTLKLDLPDVANYGSAWDEAIRNGNIAGLFAPTWFQGYISNIYSNLVGKWRSIPPPGSAFLQGAQYFGIPAKSTNQEAAWAFVKYCCAGVEGQNTLLRTSDDFPALRTAWADPLYDAPVGFFGDQRVYREWATIAESAQMLATNPYDLAIYDALNIAVRKVVDQEVDAGAALQGVEQQLMKANPGLTA
jgi:ABC-type glycerol-3-phosphate transport system substrate-binding protein